MRNLVILVILAFSLFGADLRLKEGSVSAHTEMLMDNAINPANTSLHADITMQENDIESIKGKFWVETELFKSDKSDRDEHMYKCVETDKFKLATFVISSIKKEEGDNKYTINGEMEFHGEKKPLSAKADITVTDGSLNINASSVMLVSDFGVEMPCMVFMCVRDQVDISVKAVFTLI